MTKTQILATLAADYRRAETVYTSMKKEAEMLSKQGKTAAVQETNNRARFRAGTLHGIQRAAEALGISKADFMAAVQELRPE